jgi:tetratricopeptide (TPR) repeat protein
MSDENDRGVAEETTPPSEAELTEVTPSKRPTKAPRARMKAKSPSADSAPAPKSRRVPLSKVAPKSSKSVAPRSRRATARSEVSIPPISTDLDAHGDAVVADDVTAMTPSPPPTAVTLTPRSTVTKASTDDALDLAAFPLTRPVMSPVVKVGLALAAAACLLFAGRGLIRHRARPVDTTASISVAAVAPPITATVEETIVPSSDTLVPESADDDKRASLAALEQGKIAEAIAAGERATKIDPTDADAWRVLGAAYQDQGNVIAARRCYRACVDSAKRGDTRECALLLQ